MTHIADVGGFCLFYEELKGKFSIVPIVPVFMESLHSFKYECLWFQGSALVWNMTLIVCVQVIVCVIVCAGHNSSIGVVGLCI